MPIDDPYMRSLHVFNHNLQIEKGRHTKPITPSHLRFCIVCNTQSVEDEHHFICICPAYQDLRNDFIKYCCDIGCQLTKEDFSLPKLFNYTEISFILGKLLMKMLKLRASIIDG